MKNRISPSLVAALLLLAAPVLAQQDQGVDGFSRSAVEFSFNSILRNPTSTETERS